MLPTEISCLQKCRKPKYRLYSLVLFSALGSVLVLKAVETAWKSCISVDFGDEKDGKRQEYQGKDVHVRRVRVTDIIPEMLIKWAFPGLPYACWL